MIQRMVALEKTELERALARSSILYKRLYREAPVMFFSLDGTDQKITNCNRRVKTVTGLSRRQLEGLRFVDVFEPSCRDRVEVILDDILKGKSTGGDYFSESNFLQLHRHDDEQPCYVSMSLSILTDPETQIV
jgi:PAS domain S-box-containing protein